MPLNKKVLAKIKDIQIDDKFLREYFEMLAGQADKLKGASCSATTSYVEDEDKISQDEFVPEITFTVRKLVK